MVSLSWILGIVSVLGIAGTIAAVILVPAIAIPILQSIVAQILRCKPCLYVLAVIGMCIASWWYGHHQAVLDCRAGELAAELRNKQADLDAANAAASDEKARAKSIEESANVQRSNDAAYIASLEARPACLLDDGDIGGVPNDKSRPGSKKLAPGSK